MSSAYLSQTQAIPFQKRFPCWARSFHLWLIWPPTDPLRPIIPDNARGSRITAPAGTRLGAPYSYANVNILLHVQKMFTYRSTSSITRCRSVTLSCIAEDSRLQPPVGVWTVSQFQWWGSASQLPYASLPWWAITSPTSWYEAGHSMSDKSFPRRDIMY